MKNGAAEFKQQQTRTLTFIKNISRSILRPVLDRVKKLKTYIIFSDTYLVLRTDSIQESSELDSGCLNKVTEPEKIYDIYLFSGRNSPDLKNIIHKRTKNGYSFYAFYENDLPIFYTWIMSSGYRFIHLAISIKLPYNCVFIRDAFCHEDARGKEYFKKVLQLIINQYYPSISYIYSDTEKSNDRSTSAHKKCGFEPVFKIRYFRILNKYLIRNIEPNDMSLNVYPEDKYLVAFNSDFKNYVYQNLD